MNTIYQTELTGRLATDLRAFLLLCEDALALMTRESIALAGSAAYHPIEFCRRRKDLLPHLEKALTRLRSQRLAWQQEQQNSGAQNEEIKSLFQTIQGVLMKVLTLDRENQQALLRRGLVPAQHLPPAAAQKPNFVANLYRRNDV